MYSLIHTAVLDGIRTFPVQVEADISTGMPMFDMIGYLSSEVREAKERVRTALHNCGVVLPAKRITMNLAPANIKKSGTGFDVPIAVALLCSLGIVEQENCLGRVFVGELSLNGRILPVNGILPIVSDGVKAGVKEFVVPKSNQNEAELVSDAKIYAFEDLFELMDFLKEGVYREGSDTKESINIVEGDNPKVDFADVNGQKFLKRACEVAAAGMHNMLMVGPPGSGKTMISERMSTILPPLSEEEKLELSKIYSVCGMLNNKRALLDQRPFRNPHHTVTKTGLVGGGYHPRPGEISLAHHGVLFLDELTEFQRDTIESLRQPLEDREVYLTRASSQVVYPSDFLLLAAMNPCNCGYFPDMQRCTCTPATQRRFLGKISQPLIDRIDISVQAAPLTYGELNHVCVNESSEAIRQRVTNCHELQRKRYEGEYFRYNNQIPASMMKIYCYLNKEEEGYMEHVFEEMQLTGRTYHKILRVARTIADLEGEENIKLKHLQEAICYRSFDAKHFGGGI